MQTAESAGDLEDPRAGKGTIMQLTDQGQLPALISQLPENSTPISSSAGQRAQTNPSVPDSTRTIEVKKVM